MSNTTFAERLKEERNQLKERYDKLLAFIDDSQKFETVEQKQAMLLLVQATAMNQYLMILNMRISFLEE